MIKKLALSGLLKVGKTFVAEQAGFKLVGFADPIYELSKSLLGSDNKSLPGIRKGQQTLGAWGRGLISDDYPLSFERGIYTNMIRDAGVGLAPSFSWVDWTKFGTSITFWIDILLARVSNSDMYNASVAATNCRFPSEVKPLLSSGFQHFLVMCSEETRKQRLLDSGESYTKEQDKDITEEYARTLEDKMPESKIIWNDHRQMPEGRNLLTVEDFRKLVTQQPEFPL